MPGFKREPLQLGINSLLRKLLGGFCSYVHTTPFTVSILIFTVLRPGTAKMVALAMVVISASSITTLTRSPYLSSFSRTLSAAASIFLLASAAVSSIFLPAVSAGPGFSHAVSPTTKSIEMPINVNFSNIFILIPFSILIIAKK
ncbi:MAG: hypothetical protein ABI284_06760, partial [Nitrosospira sp.]